MPIKDDLEHYAARERQARELAEAATDPRIKAIHLDMAERYVKRQNEANSSHVAEQPLARTQR